MILKKEKEEITKSFLQNQKAGTGMQMYKVMMLPMAEEDIMNNTDYIEFEKKHLKQRQNWQWVFVTPLPNLSLCLNSMNWMRMKNQRREKSGSAIIKTIRYISLQMKELEQYMC